MKKLMSFAASIVLVIAACGEEKTTTTEKPTTSTTTATTFAAVHTYLVANCKSCHMDGGSTDVGSAYKLTGTEADDYAIVNTTALVSTSSAAESNLLTRPTSSDHGGGILLTTSDTNYKTILAWIEGGATK